MVRTDAAATFSSAPLLEKPPMIDKKVKRHSIHGMMEEENVIRPHQEIAQLSLDEKKFLLAVERGDVASTRRTLQRAEETGFININCVDPLGRSALLMAIDNENLEMVELLIEHKVETKDALLHAISEEFVEAVEVLLDHEETIHKPGEPHSWEALPPDTATFTPDITPLILSAHRDNYEIIKILLDRGATLPMPHDVRCGCDECVTSRMEDSLRHSRSRINAYRALASPSLIALSSKDPILTAFELSWELRRLSLMEHEFKSEYQELRKQCQDFATALLDHTRSSYELEVLLNHDPTGPAFEHGDRMHLNRLKLAIKLRQKKIRNKITISIPHWNHLHPFITMALTKLIILTICVSVVTPLDIPDGFQEVAKGIKELFHTGHEPDFLAKALEQHQMPHVFRDGMQNVYDHPVICFFCNLIADLAIGERRLGASRDVLAKEVEFLCEHLGIESERVCKGAIELNIDVFVYIVDNYPNLDSHRVCGSVLQGLGCSSGDNFEWSIELPSGSSAVRPKPNDTLQTFQILQLSDIHYDPNYLPYGNADCGEPICCQSDQGEPSSVETTCGYWTDYRYADTPWHLVEETVRQAKTQEFDYVYYTGDIISHRVWETSVANNSKDITKLFSYFKETFDVPVYPVFGNHEPHPLDLWPTESVKDDKFSVQWLFELVADSWSELVGEDIRETVLKGGYYTVSPKPGFRIVAINGNLCYTYNWWLIFDDVDPYGQLQWLSDTLLEAEKNKESVHILSHVPTGTSESLTVWGREYARIVERFANTITGQFNGHTHRDEFHVYYNSSEPTQPIGVAFNGASVTPYTSANPSYKIYKVESTTFNLLDYEEWTFNLTLANSKNSELPDWYKLYSFVEAFGVDNLSPVEVDKVLYKMAENHTLLDDYFRFKVRNGDDGIKEGCDDSCKKTNLCEIATTVWGFDTHCNRFSEMYDKGQ